MAIAVKKILRRNHDEKKWPKQIKRKGKAISKNVFGGTSARRTYLTSFETRYPWFTFGNLYPGVGREESCNSRKPGAEGGDRFLGQSVPTCTLNLDGLAGPASTERNVSPPPVIEVGATGRSSREDVTGRHTQP